ncbi:Uncharacterized protein conserved in cyanobacteria [Gloeomargarita lithophora Alchichica-D10]|uniref:Uncharacterized protein conserved in cyanobacteria n=1 Tax=Gloeomargarita lithophora Alchichica-D10 TaxID=1188229 RepID=A0A1J0AD14_9CYAN|nr:Uma2 family endonuclease [Gloeomargarita lithophora]APB33828.1 Uncharacterized protein conserved in cyanobacteria [Gloeomargarita lithophora Alchichica-D10]
MIANFHEFISANDYLKWEAQQEIRYEYLDGQVYGMTGGTVPHNDITLNLATALKTFLRGTDCKVQMADVKVIFAEQGAYFYPDIVVTCDAQDRQARDGIRSPRLIVEVLSPGTAGFDYGQKFRRYRRLLSLQEYVLIDSETIGVDCYRHREDGQWQLTSYPDHGNRVELVSIGYSCPLAVIYENVDFIPPPNP